MDATGAGVVTAAAKAAVVARRGIAIMMNDLMVVVVMEEGLMIGISSLRRGAGEEGAAVLAGEVEGAGALVVGGGTEAQRGKAVLREGPKLNNGTGSGSKLQLPVLPTIMASITMILMMAMHRTMGITMIGSRGDTAAIEDVVCSSSFSLVWHTLRSELCIGFHFQWMAI